MDRLLYNRRNIKKIENELIGNYTPCDSNVLRFSTVDLKKVKIIILGQEPYSQKGMATGRSFEVNGFESWAKLKGNNSLNNILKLLYKAYMDEDKELSIIKNDIAEEKFRIRDINEVFDYWEKQGVLFLNIALTCEIGDPKNHIDIWSKFTEEMLKYIIDKNCNIKYFLWGREVVDKVNTIKKFENSTKYESTHPVASRGSNNLGCFSKNECFKKTKDEIKWIE